MRWFRFYWLDYDGNEHSIDIEASSRIEAWDKFWNAGLKQVNSVTTIEEGE